MNIIFNIATVPRRRESFLKVLHALSIQTTPCAHINIACSYGYDKEIRLFVDDNFKSNTIIHGQFSCEKKFFGFDVADPDSYFLTFDDDIIYPPNYSRALINGIDRYSRQAVVGYHGMKFIQFPVTDFYSQRRMYQYFQKVDLDKQLDIIGSGVSGCYVATLKQKGFSNKTLSHTSNMTDDVLSKFCRDNQIKMVCLQHRAQWIRIMPGTQDDDATWKVAHANNHIQNLKLLNA